MVGYVAADMTSCFGGNDMTLKTVVIGAVLVIGGVLLGMNYPIADAQWRGGPYALSAISTKPGAVWRMNQRTGQVSFCFLEGDVAAFKSETPTPRQSKLITPRCAPWGPITER